MQRQELEALGRAIKLMAAVKAGIEGLGKDPSAKTMAQLSLSLSRKLRSIYKSSAQFREDFDILCILAMNEGLKN